MWKRRKQVRSATGTDYSPGRITTQGVKAGTSCRNPARPGRILKAKQGGKTMKGIIKFGKFRIPLNRFISVEPHEGELRVHYLRCDSQVHYISLDTKGRGWTILDVDKALANAISEDAEKLEELLGALQSAEDRFRHVQRLVESVRKYRNWKTMPYTIKEYYGHINRTAYGGLCNVRKALRFQNKSE